MIRIDESACNGCRTCVHVCPYGCLEMQNKKAVVVREDSCIECGACACNCHENAAIVTQGTGCVVHILMEDLAKLRRRWASA